MEQKDFKKRGVQAGSRGGCLKKGEGAGTTLRTMNDLILPILLILT